MLHRGPRATKSTGSCRAQRAIGAVTKFRYGFPIGIHEANPVSVLGIDHIQLAMPAGEETKAREFYCGVLLLTEKVKPPDLAKRGGAWFTNGSIEVHLGVEKDFRAARKAHPALVVRDLEGFIERARARGCEIGTDVPLPGYERIFIYYLFGNRLELIDPHAAR